MFTYYQDANLYYFRKPAGIPSTFGKQPSFLDFLLKNISFTKKVSSPHNDKEVSSIVQSLFAFFWTEKELWLLNRLDNDTSGLLYFAKNPRVYRKFKEMQSNLQLWKYYVAEVYGDIREAYGNIGEAYRNIEKISHWTPWQGSRAIARGVAHHRFNSDRMLAIKHPSDLQKAKGTLHHLTTEILESQFLPATKTSIVLLRIQKGIRHQIRVHLSSIGYPICGDKLYSKSAHTHYDTLQLFSVGLETNDLLQDTPSPNRMYT